jgi:hypothetical protein
VAAAAGFDDPEVMAAVAEVARDPKAFAKHAKNPKVRRQPCHEVGTVLYHSYTVWQHYHSCGAYK